MKSLVINKENPKGIRQDITEEELAQFIAPIGCQIAELKQKLADTDYNILKIVEGAATLSEMANIIKQRKAWRAEINELEKQL